MNSSKAIKLVEEILLGQVEKLSEEDLSLLAEEKEGCVRKILPILAFEITQIQEEEEFCPSRLQFSLQLASFFQEPKAFDWICQLHPFEEVVQEALGEEFIPTHWAAILANTVGSEIDRLKKEIETSELDEEIRRAALEALTVLVSKGKLERSKVVTYFQGLYQKALKGEVEDPFFCYRSCRKFS